MFHPQDGPDGSGSLDNGPGRGQVLGPGQEKDDLRINTDPPLDMNLGCREVGRPCP